MNRTLLWGEEGFGNTSDPRLIQTTAEGYELKQVEIAGIYASRHELKGVRELEDQE